MRLCKPAGERTRSGLTAVSEIDRRRATAMRVRPQRGICRHQQNVAADAAAESDAEPTCSSDRP